MNQNQVQVPEFTSESLKGNPLGDPELRKLPIYFPPSYDKSQKSYPVVYFLAGFTGTGLSMLNYSAFEPNVPERIDKLIREEKIPEIIAVMPDCMTKLLGSQFVNSSAIGNYEDYILEIAQYVDKNYRTLAQPESRALVGKSSGGYGSFMLAMKHPDIFSYLGCHSGDMYFEYCYKHDFPHAYNALYRYQSVKKFQDYIARQHKIPGRAFSAVNLIGMGAAYSPLEDKPGEFELPFDLKTGEIRDEVWQRWLKFDPVEIVGDWKENLEKLRLIFIDCGSRDEYHLHIGARILSQRLDKLGISHTHEEFDDTHRSISYRYDRSLEVIGQTIAMEMIG